MTVLGDVTTIGIGRGTILLLVRILINVDADFDDDDVMEVVGVDNGMVEVNDVPRMSVLCGGINACTRGILYNHKNIIAITMGTTRVLS
jgi:hypothetical protein